MSDYASKKVAELKELLSARGLAVSGNKADLVARLEEADKAAPAETSTETTTETASTTETAAPATTESVAEDKPAEVIEVEEKAEEPAETITVEDEVVEISDEDKTKAAIEDLEKQIKRKKRFATGEDADVAELEKQLERIKRFGVSAAPTNGLSLDKGLDALKKERKSGKVRRESVTKDKSHPYKKSENGLKPGVVIATADDEKIKARQARFSQ
ncbi:hypothetical protein CJU89_2616 [Yarrowia sp. B02]|nr:hypothetical protein CJU89_2616 [Yarrowia sp. B02]